MNRREMLKFPVVFAAAVGLSGCVTTDAAKRPTLGLIGEPLSSNPAGGATEAALRGTVSGNTDGMGSRLASSVANSPHGSAIPAAPEVAGPVDLGAVVASHTRGYAGHAVAFTGGSFGHSGSVTWGDEPCVVTSWTPSRITVYLPSRAQPATRELVVHADGQQSGPLAFTVAPPEIEPSRVARDAFAFVRDKMRTPEGGVYTNFVDRDDPDPVYLYGHHQTAEHMGLILWVSAAIQDHQTFEESYQYVARKLISRRYGVVNWGVNKFTNDVALQEGADPEDSDEGEEPPPLLHANAPLDDFRVVKGLISGWLTWRDERYRDLALRIGEGLYETSITAPNDFPLYRGGLVAEGCLWDELTGVIKSTIDVIPVNYADLWVMHWLAQYDPRWNAVIASHSQLMVDAQIPASGQFWNSYLRASMTFSGDWEYRGEIRGDKIKTIQSLWTAIHLARAGRREPAQRALDFYKAKYARTGRVAEYYNPDGSEVTERFFIEDTLMQGEVRIYSQVARLAYWLGDKSFGDRVIREKVMTDQDTVPWSRTYGRLGSGAGAGDAEAWESLEGLIGLLLHQGAAVLMAEPKG